MQTFSSAFQAELNKGQFEPRILVDLYELYEPDYVPSAVGFDPDDAIERFSAEQITWNGNAYRREVVSRGDISLSIGAEENSVTITFSNISRYMATLNQTQVLEGLFCVIRAVSPTVTDDSRVLITGRLGKPSTIDKKTFTIDVRQDFGGIHIEAPTSKFIAEDPNGRLPSDPLYEGIRFVAQAGSYSYPGTVPSTSLIGLLLGKKKKVVYTKQWSSLDQTPYGQAIPELFGSCQMQAIPIIFQDIGGWLEGLWVWCKGPIDTVTNIEMKADGFFGLYDIQTHTGEAGGTGTPIVRGFTVPVVGGNVTLDFRFPGSGLFSYLSFSGISILEGNIGFTNVITEAPPIVGLVRGRKVPRPDSSGAYVLNGWTENPVHIARFILTSDRFANINEAFMEDSINYLTSLHCDEYVIDDTDSQVIQVPAPDLPVAGTAFKRFRSTGILTPDYFNYYDLGAAIPPPETVDGPYNGFDLFLPPGGCPPGYHYDPSSGDCVPNDPGNGTGPPVNYTQPLLRKRYTANFPITDEVRVIDLLHNTLNPAAKLFLRVNKRGKYEIRSEQPSDATRIRTAVAVNDTTINVNDVLPWKTGPDLLAGRVLLGFGLTTSEVRNVSSAAYSADGNSITLAAEDEGTTTLTASGATLTGGSSSVRASGTFTVGGTPANGDIIRAVIGGITVGYILSGATLGTAAAMLAAYISATIPLKRIVDATWDAGSPNVITIQAKLGTLTLDSPLLKTHGIGVSDPAVAPTIAAGAGSLLAGVYKVAYADQTATGLTRLTPYAEITLTVNQKIAVSSLPAFPAGVTSRVFYLSETAGSDRLRYVTIRTDATNFDINALPLPNAALPPTENTTAEELIRGAMSLATNSQDVLPAWGPVKTIVLNDIYLPTSLNGHKYKATSITTGITTSTEPTWPLTSGGTVVDGGVTWTEFGETVLGQAGLTRANVIKDTYNFPMGSEQSTVNQIKISFRDRKNDFALTPHIVNDYDHQLQVGKAYPEEVDGSAIDNFNQMERIANWQLAKLREGDCFYTMATGPQGLVMEEGDPIFSSDDAGGLINEVARIEALSINSKHEVTITRARKYSSNMFSDDARAQTIPVPTTLRFTGTAPSVSAFIDLFAIRSGDEQIPGFYLSVSHDLSVLGDWRGWTLFPDYGSGYVEIANGDVAATMGVCTSTLDTVAPWADPTDFDNTSDVTFTLKSGQSPIGTTPFVSVTEAELLADPSRNLFWSGTEYFQAATITDNGSLSFTLSDLLRGRFNTNTTAHLTHSASEQIVYLNGAEQLIPMDMSRINLPFNYKVVTINEDVDDVSPISFTWTGGTIKDPDPTTFLGFYDPVDGALLNEWGGNSQTVAGFKEEYDLEYNYSGSGSPGTPRLVKVIPALNTALAEKVIWEIVTDNIPPVTMIGRGGFDIQIDASGGATIRSKRTAEVVGGFRFEFQVPPSGLTPLIVAVHPDDPGALYGGALLPGSLFWQRDVINGANPPTRPFYWVGENPAVSIYDIYAGDRLYINIRPDGIAEYGINYGSGTAPIFTSAIPVDQSILYRVTVLQFDDFAFPGTFGIREAIWVRQGPEFLYNAAAQVLDGVDGEPQIYARVRQNRGGAVSTWVLGTFTR